jgi:translation initiation factor IF-1
MVDNNSKETSKETVSGVVIETLPNTLFRIKPDDSQEEILGYLAGKMRIHRIRVLVGDKVLMITDPYGGKARITRRL